MNIAVIQARMSSTRLPGKVMEPILGKPLLYYLVNRIKLSKKIDLIIIATTKEKSDNVIYEFGLKNNIDVYRGETDNVLGRIFSSVSKYKPRCILRITADCPLIDPHHCDLIVDTLVNNNLDYVSLGQTYAEGADLAAISFEALKKSHEKSQSSLEREHITLYIHNHPEDFKRFVFENEADDSMFRFTVDEENDFEVVRNIIEYYIKMNKIHFSYQEIIDFLKSHPGVSNLNSDIVRNEGYIKTLAFDGLKQKRNILFRVDGSNKIGWGHVMRCIGIAGEFKKYGYKSTFISSDKDPEVLRIIKSHNFKIELLPKKISFKNQALFTCQLIKKYNAKSMIVDLSNQETLRNLSSFKLYVELVKKSIKNLVIIDGLYKDCISSRLSLDADMVIIPYAGAAKKNLLKKQKTLYLLGPSYAVIREELLVLRKQRKLINKKAKNILILPGGSKNDVFLVKIFTAMGKIKHNDYTFKVLTKNKTALAISKKIPALEYVQNTNRVPTLYKWADIAISASGLTLYELAYIGIPLLVIAHNKSHEISVLKLQKKGFLRYAGIKQTVSIKKLVTFIDNLIENNKNRIKMSTSGKKFIDGKGAKRIVSRIIMNELLH